jgi:broad specificity phosphatase PhoE
MRIFLIRHADPDYPNNTITPAGHLEAKALAIRMQRTGLDRIYSSPLGRAQDTARYTADALGMEPTIIPWTAELAWARVEQEGYGKSVVWDIHGHTIHLQEYSRGSWHEAPPFDHPDFRDGFAQIRQESDAFLAGLGYRRNAGTYEIEQSNRLRVAVFCHGGFGLTWLAHLLNIPVPLVWAGFFLPPSSVTTILFDERSQGIATPRCVGVGDISHLYAEGLPMQPSGIKANTD